MLHVFRSFWCVEKRLQHQFEYSNVGYFVLAAVVEQVSGESFEGQTREFVNSIGLNGLGFVGDGEVEGRRATTRIVTDRYGRGSRGSLFAYPWNWGQRGATGVVMSADTAARWFEMVGNGQWISPELHEEMVSPDRSGYGLGVYVDLDD